MSIIGAKLDLSNKLSVVKVKYGTRIKESDVARSARTRVQVLICSIVCQSVEALDSFINQVGTQLMDCVCTGLKGVSNGSQLS